jgi:hypothetical protein
MSCGPTPWPGVLSLFAALALLAGCGPASVREPAPSESANHPRILVAPEQRDTIREKIENAPWAKAALERIKADVDKHVARTSADPEWMTSRLAMNWDTHYTTPVTTQSRLVGGEGRAPVPTPRFAGARDWATRYSAPEALGDLKPRNDWNGKIWLRNDETGESEWVEPAVTGRTIESINARIMDLAAKAGFLHWLTGEKKYGRFAADIVWTYMAGFAHVTPPKIDPPDKGSADIIGMTSFEVIHEDIVTPISLAYDFAHAFLVGQGRDVSVIQDGLKRMIDRVIEGGGREGNWNLNQARIIAYGGLALEDDDQYADGKGRAYYTDIVLHADLPAQRGIVRVVEDGLDQTTALWPEAPGYGFGTAKDLLLIATLVGAEPDGQALLNAPILKRAVPAQERLLYPDGWSTGLGDTYHTRLSAMAAELMIAASRRSGDEVTEKKVTGLLAREIEGGFYRRDGNADLVALTQFVDALSDAPAAGPVGERVSYGKPLNIVVQRNVRYGDAEHALAGALYGTDGGHVHANGLAMELYGAGAILAPDPGRGTSYWTPDHGEYYSQPPAHNTVIVNGISSYSAHGADHVPMKIERMEPQPGQPGVSPDVSFVRGSFAYPKPPANQSRTLALIRTGPRSGFYLDIFRSRAESGEGFHDYLYHGLGRTMELSDAAGKPLPLKTSLSLISGNGLLKGYDYFEDEASAKTGGTFRGTIATETGGAAKGMRFWMPGDGARTVFAVSAPPTRSVRESWPEFMDIRMPTLVVRRKDDVWRRPFIAVYEPFVGETASAIRSVRVLKGEVAGCVIEGDGFEVVAMDSDQPGEPRQIEGVTFDGDFAVAIRRGSEIAELYLGSGRQLAVDGVALRATGDAPIAASLRRIPGGWSCGISGEAVVRVGSREETLQAGTHEMALSDE